MQQGQIAYNQKEANSFGDLQNIADQALDKGAKTKEELTSDLQQVTDLKSAIKKIDIAIEINNIKATINKFNSEADKAKSLGSLMETLDKKQVYLTSIYNKLEHPENMDKAVVGMLKNNQQDQEINNIEKLTSLSRRLMNFENKTENDILNELKGINNFNAACEKIGRKVEENLVRKNIYVLDKNLNNSKTAIEAANILTHKQFYIANLDKTLDYIKQAEPKLITTIADAKLDTQENSADNLTNLTAFVVSEKSYRFDNRAILNCIKDSTSISEGLTNLTTNYQAAYMKDIADDLSTIEKTGELRTTRKTYNSTTEYLTEKITCSHKDYAPQDTLKELLDKTIETQNQKERNAGDFER